MEHCKNEETIKDLVEFKGGAEADIKNIFSFIKELKANHLFHIYKELKFLRNALTGRPTWIVTAIISFLTGLIFLLLREVISRL